MSKQIVNTDYLGRLQKQVHETLTLYDGVTHAFVPRFHLNCNMLTLIHTCRNKPPNNVRLDSGFIYAEYGEYDDGMITLSAPLED